MNGKVYRQELHILIVLHASDATGLLTHTHMYHPSYGRIIYMYLNKCHPNYCTAMHYQQIVSICLASL